MFTGFILLDCNNFFVSCERIHNPGLNGVPVVVLSGNEGVILSRSQEAKALGIPMGAPYFQWADFIERQRVIAITSHFSLYAEVSAHVMETLAHFHGEIQVSSVDEAFLWLEKEKDPLAYTRLLWEEVTKKTKVPVSIGLGSTKTLAKLAAERAKKDASYKSVCGIFDDRENILKETKTVDIWGIGRRTSLALSKKGVHTAFELIEKDDLWIAKYFGVHLLQTALELRGQVVFPFDKSESARQSILTSRTFPKTISDRRILEEKVVSFAMNNAKRLRSDKTAASQVIVFLTTSRHKDNYIVNEEVVVLPEATDQTPQLIEAARKGFAEVFQEGIEFKRAGVLFGGIVSAESVQRDLFVSQSQLQQIKRQKVKELIDQANQQFGYEILSFYSRDHSD